MNTGNRPPARHHRLGTYPEHIDIEPKINAMAAAVRMDRGAITLDRADKHII
jgi:hypothetical protein